MQIQNMQNFIEKDTENQNELLTYIKGENYGMSRFDREQQREILLLINMGLKTYEIQYLIHLKNKEKLGKKWRR